jgi:hypothetical protein
MNKKYEAFLEKTVMVEMTEAEVMECCYKAGVEAGLELAATIAGDNENCAHWQEEQCGTLIRKKMEQDDDN